MYSKCILSVLRNTCNVSAIIARIVGCNNDKQVEPTVSSNKRLTVKLGDVGLHGIMTVPPTASRRDTKVSACTKTFKPAETEYT